MKKIITLLICTILIFTQFSLSSFKVDAAKEENFIYTISNGEAIIENYDKYNGVKGELIIPSYLGGYPVTKINQSAFSYNNYITKVVLPNTLTWIGTSAFSGCQKIETIVIPASLQELSNHTFDDCNISKVYISDLVAWCNITYTGGSVGDGPLCSGNGELYLNDSPITKLIIPEGVTRIPSEAFYGCKSISCVVLPKSLISISSRAFKNCINIKDVWYVGDEIEKEKVSIDSSNSPLTSATWHYDSCPVGAPHTYSNDCDDTCNGCDKTRTVSRHNYDNACDTTCNICNDIRNVTHSYDNSCDTQCNICNEPRTISHIYDNSCDTQCNVCNSSRTISHTYGEWDVTKQASCTESGTKVRKCGVCSKTETETIPSIGHDFSNEWTIDEKATCTTAGSKSKHCTRCSATINNTTILASGHNWGEWVTEKKATVETEGLSVRKCNECDLNETQTIAKLAADGHTHKFGEWQIIKAATCKEKGNAKRICSVCKEEEQKELLATGHQVGEWVETSATCTNDGNRERVCVICNETEKITIKALGHDFENPVVIKEPTDNEKGIKQGKCKRCGEETTEEIPALLSENDNASNTDSDKITDDGNENKGTNNNWIIWTIIGVFVLIAIGLGVYLLLKHNRKK